MAGYKYNYCFISEIDDSLNCVICLEVAKEAKKHESCGKLYCKHCLEKVINDCCPYCSEDNPVYFPDKLSKLQIKP